ncbi:hypothetical protein MXD81_06935 [Microbacteriaceae bacterium K1510]|nr:hypothetical protein [Microbacteriaceae bacterium K1510]
MLVDAAQIAAAQGDAMAIEEFEDLDRDLSAIVDAVAKLRCGELPARCRSGAIDNDLHHLGDGRAQEEMIVRHFIDLAHAADELQEAAHIRLAHIEQPGDVAHAWRPETLSPADQRRDATPQGLVLGREPHRMAREPHPSAVERDLARFGKSLKEQDESGRRQARRKLQAQRLEADAGQVRMLAMELRERFDERAFERKPARGR